MENRRKASVLLAFAGACAGGSAPLLANTAIPRGAGAVVLAAMGILLFFGGYYLGLARKQQ